MPGISGVTGSFSPKQTEGDSKAQEAQNKPKRTLLHKVYKVAKHAFTHLCELLSFIVLSLLMLLTITLFEPALSTPALSNIST